MFNFKKFIYLFFVCFGSVISSNTIQQELLKENNNKNVVLNYDSINKEDGEIDTDEDEEEYHEESVLSRENEISSDDTDEDDYEDDANE